jgi:SAM-dependent methyltransferase
LIAEKKGKLSDARSATVVFTRSPDHPRYSRHTLILTGFADRPCKEVVRKVDWPVPEADQFRTLGANQRDRGSTQQDHLRLGPPQLHSGAGVNYLYMPTKIGQNVTLDQVVEDYNLTPFGNEFPFFKNELSYHQLLVDLGLKYLPQEGPAAVLDIGTGRGICPRFFSRRGIRAITLDFPTTGGNKTLQDAARAGVETHECDCSQGRFPLPPDSVDCVYLSDVIEHLPHSPKALLNEIHRVLRPGGACITSTPNSVRLTVRLKILLGNSNWPRISDYFNEPFHVGHHHEYTESELRYVHECAGFRISEMQTVELNALNAPVDSLGDLQSGNRQVTGKALKFGFSRKIIFGITQMVPRLRGQMVLVAQKP